MSRTFTIPILAVAFLAAPMLISSALPGVSGQAYAKIKKHITGTKQHGTARATTVKSSKSNTSDRAINLNSSRSNRY